MRGKLRVVPILLIAMAVACDSCSTAPKATGGSKSDAPHWTAADAEKVLIPHASWSCGMPEGIPKPENGTLVFEAEMKLSQIYDVGQTQYGRRQVLVVDGGTVTGPKFQGSVMAGSLDFQLTLSNGVLEIEQVFMLRAADGRYIHMRNAGTGVNPNDVRMVVDIEAPTAGTSAWLNSGKYVGRRVVDAASKSMKMSVYEVSQAAVPGAQGVIKIAKPAGVREQPWDYRKANPAEKRGELFVTENVTLGPSQSVGASKKGNRNVIPITGGTLTGAIIGKVLPGGADYQNLTTAPTIDARYLWQANNGEVIIVRNTGGFGGLVPIFETRVDGQFAWLNEGNYLSSSPGVGAGGVSLTMYKSTQ